MDILKAIWNGEYNTEHRPSEEYKALIRKNSALEEAHLSPLSGEAIDELHASYADLTGLESYESFLAGLRLGMAVMREYYQ